MSETEQLPPFQGTKAGVKKASAGKCDKCGFFKTWQFKVLNPSSGKYMPAHINSTNGQDAEVLGDGDCPKYATNTTPPAAAPPVPAAKPSTAPSTGFQTAEQLFNVTDADKRLIECIKKAAVSALSDDLKEVIAILREIRDGKTRTKVNAEGQTWMAEGDLPARSRE